MSVGKPVVVYGASGYTGRLMCEYLRELNVPFTAMGRDKDRVQGVMDRIPGIETAEYDVVQVDHTVEALSEAFDGAQVVLSSVGPFSSYGPATVEAALAAGAHYTDTTGEQDWLITAKERWGAQFAAAGLLLAPGTAQMYTTGEIAANVCLETPGIDTLDVLVLWRGLPTYASTQTIFAILRATWYYLENNQYVEWPQDTHYEVNVPGHHVPALVTPWAGTAHPVWFKDDPRVSNVKALGGVFSREVMDGFVATQKMYQEQLAPLSEADREKALADIAASIQAGMPPRENARINVSLDSVYGSGPLARAGCVIHGNRNYQQTALLQAYSAFSLLQRAPMTVGFGSACQAFGHRTLLSSLQSFGLVMEPVVTVNR